MHHWCTSMHWCLCWYSALIWLENTWFSSPLPLILPLFLFYVVQSIANYFLVSFLSFRHDDKSQKPELKILESSENLPRWHAVLSAFTIARWWRPGRVETSRRSGEWTSTSSACSPRALLVVRASLTPPSLSIWLLTFPEKDGVEHALLREADLPIFIPTVTGCKGNVNQRLPPCARWLPAVPHRLYGFLAARSFLQYLLATVDNVDSSLPNLRRRSRQREFDSMPYPSCFQVISPLSPPCRQTSLNAAQTLDKQSASAAVCELEYVCWGWTDDTD